MTSLRLSVVFLCVMLTFRGNSQGDTYVKLSTRFIQQLQHNLPVTQIVDSLKNVSQEVLAGELNSDDKKKTFWMNVYNGMVQYLLTNDPKLFDDRGSFFSKKRMVIAGEELSFDNVEHGLIRGSRHKLTLGYTKKLFVGKFQKKFRVKKRDGRVHYALNCGAKSCPPVAAYDYTKLDQQMDASSKLYLEKNCQIEGKVAHVPALFLWFKADFGGSKGIKKNFLVKYGIVKDTKLDLKFNKYDWTLYTGNYIEL